MKRCVLQSITCFLPRASKSEAGDTLTMFKKNIWTQPRTFRPVALVPKVYNFIEGFSHYLIKNVSYKGNCPPASTWVRQRQIFSDKPISLFRGARLFSQRPIMGWTHLSRLLWTLRIGSISHFAWEAREHGNRWVTLLLSGGLTFWPIAWVRANDEFFESVEVSCGVPEEPFL